MKKDETATPAAKGAPYAMVKGPMPEHVLSADLPDAGERPAPTPRVPGPATGIDALSDGEYVRIAGTPEELKTFRQSIEARKSHVAQTGWRILPNGSRIRADQVLAGCNVCGRWVWVGPKHAAGDCPLCNPAGRVGGGRLRRATVAEDVRWHQQETDGIARWKADAPKRQAKVDAFNERQLEDKGIR